MKKIVLILIAFLSISTATFASDCDPLCDPLIYPWTSTAMTRSYGPCMITIYYSHRQCPSGKELRLDRIVTSNECLLSLDVALDFATRYLLNNSFEIFGIIGTSVDLNFSADCCWERIGTGVGDFPPYTYEPCDGQTCCCETELTIKKFIEFGVEKRRYIDSKNLISDGTGAICLPPCYKMCDVFDDLTTGVGVSPIYAGDCDDECSSTWNSIAVPLTKTYNGTCFIQIYYDWRECGTDTVEVKISSIKYSGSGCGNIDEIMKEGIEKVLSSVATKTTSRQIQVRLSTCWKNTTILDQNYVQSCYEDDCCAVVYKLEGGGDEFTITDTDITSKYSVCRNINGCTFICNSTHLGVPEDEILMKLALESIDGNLFETTSEVIPNPAIESISLNVNSKVDGKLQITITDVNGKSVYEDSINKTSETIQVLINIKAFAKGTYFYNIRAGLYDINGGKFIKE